MKTARGRVVLIIGILVGIILVAVVGGLRALRSLLYPVPASMPAVVGPDMPDLLARLEKVLSERASGVLASHQPGLTDEAIRAIESSAGITLPDDLRALYRWRNGSPVSTKCELIPMYRFVPLEEAISQRTAMSNSGGSLLQRLVFGAVAGHRSGWLTVLDDSCGDGYFYDPGRPQGSGAFFYCFAEDRTYHFFPSVRNFIAGVIECYETGVYRTKADGSLDENFYASPAVWSHYAGSPE